MGIFTLNKMAVALMRLGSVYALFDSHSRKRLLNDLVLNEQFIKTMKGGDFLLFGSGPDETRMLIFGTKANLNFLSKCHSVYMDGTFDVTPPLFKQIYTIHTW